MKIIIISLVGLLASCTVLDKRIGLYSPKLVLDKSQEVSTEKVGEWVEGEVCNQMFFIFPTGRKNQFDALEELLGDKAPYNALANAQVKTSFFFFPLIYLRNCHKVSGTLVQLNVDP